MRARLAAQSLGLGVVASLPVDARATMHFMGR